MTAPATQAARAVAYYRMSTDRQEESIPQQQGAMRPRAKLAGIEIVREFQDEGITGGRMDQRDAFNEMLAFCQAEHRRKAPVEAVVCWDTKRFSRATSIETNHYLWEFMQAGVYRLFTYTDGWIDFRKEEHRILFNLRQDVSNNRDLRERSKDIVRGKVENAQAGRWNGSIAPYGFDRLLVDRDGRPVQRLRRGEKIAFKGEGCSVVLVPTENPEPLEVVRWLFREYAYTETSLHALARTLNERGVAGAGSGLKRSGGRVTAWSTGQVARLLSNPAYVGDYRYGRRASGAYHRYLGGEIREADFRTGGDLNDAPILLTDNHPGVVDRATWDAVQAKLKARAAGKRKTRVNGMPLTGLAHCGNCGAWLYGERHRHRHYYTCSGNKVRPGTCRYYTIREDLLLGALVRKIQETYLAPPKLTELRRALRERVKARHAADPAKAERLRGKLAEIDRDIKQGAKNLIRATDNLDLIQEELIALRALRERTARELEAAEQDQGLTPPEAARRVDAAVAKLATLGRRLSRCRPEQLREVLSQMVTRIDVYWDAPRPAKNGKRHWSVFAKGVVKLRPQLDVSGSGAPVDAGVTLPETHLVITPADLAAAG